MSNEMRSTAVETLPSCAKATERSRTESSVSVKSPPRKPDGRSRLVRGVIPAAASFERLPRVEGVARRLADEDQQRQHQRNHDEAGDAEPGRVEIALALLEQFAER